MRALRTASGWAPSLAASGALLLVAQLALAYQQSGATSLGSSSSYVRLRANRLRKADACRESLPRRAADLPALVVSARVKELYLSGQGDDNKALVTVKRVIKGNQQLLDTDLIVGGFNASSASGCPNHVKPNDTFILLLQSDGERKYQIHQGNLLSMNLNNLERVNAIASDEPYKRRPPIEDILCEAHYCAYGRCVVGERAKPTCHCPDSCPPLPSPVCGSDNATYTNECQLIREGCRRQRPLFVTRESAC